MFEESEMLETMLREIDSGSHQITATPNRDRTD